MAIITISRGTFTGGQALAEALAERLGYQCLSREGLIEAARADYGVSVEKLTAAMDEPPSFWERLSSERGLYVDFQRAALRERARRNELVFHGYVGHLLLPRVSHVISLRVVEEMDSRVALAMRRHNMQRKDALAFIKKKDRQRSDWTRFLWGVDWQDATLYDAVLNLSRMGIPGACDIAAGMVEQPAFQPAVESLKAVEDAALGSRVWAALAMDPIVGGADLKVVADGGAVTVSGSVISAESSDAISPVARKVEGVRAVWLDVSVNPPVYDIPI